MNHKDDGTTKTMVPRDRETKLKNKYCLLAQFVNRQLGDRL